VGTSSPTRSCFALPSLPVAGNFDGGFPPNHTSFQVAPLFFNYPVGPRGETARTERRKLYLQSPINGAGDVIFQFCEARSWRDRLTSPLFLLISTLEISSFWKGKNLTGALAAAFRGVPRFGWCRLDQ